MHMHIVLHVNILPNITRLEIRFCTLHLKTTTKTKTHLCFIPPLPQYSAILTLRVTANSQQPDTFLARNLL